MRSPDVIKKGLACHGQSRTYMLQCSDCEYHGQGLPHCREAVHEDAIALIEQLQAQLPKWISVEERLPEENVNVLVYAIGNNENSVIAMTSYTNRLFGYDIKGWRSPWQYFFHEYKITHWMTLPEPPQEDNNVETN